MNCFNVISSGFHYLTQLHKSIIGKNDGKLVHHLPRRRLWTRYDGYSSSCKVEGLLPSLHLNPIKMRQKVVLLGEYYSGAGLWPCNGAIMGPCTAWKQGGISAIRTRARKGLGREEVGPWGQGPRHEQPQLQLTVEFRFARARPE